MDIIKPFLIGGSVIAGSKYVSLYASPALAPLIGGMPTGIISSFFLKSDKDKRKFYEGYVYSSFILFLSIVLCHLLSSKTSLNVDIISAISIVAWAIISYIVVNYFVVKK